MSRSRRGSLLATGFLATAVVFGGAGVGVGVAIAGTGHDGLQGDATLPTAAQSQPGGADLSVATIAGRVEPATVDLTATGGAYGPDEGTGMILTRSGIVLTNNHVVDGSTRVEAQVNGQGRTYRASFLGADPTEDVALLQLHGGGRFKTVTLGDSSGVTVGDQVVAIGNALALTGPETVTSGSISATGRTVTVSDTSTGLQETLKDLFQTSAAIAPGNSGGPLVNPAGQVIGMNTASVDTADGVNDANIGFAIPIGPALSIARRIQDGDNGPNLFVGPPPVLGVQVETVACAEDGGNGNGNDCSALGDPFDGFPFGSGVGYVAPVAKGAVVTAADEGSPAATAGLAVGDVIVSVDGHAVTTPGQFTARLQAHKVGQKIDVAWVDQHRDHHVSSLQLVAGPNP